MIFLKSKVLITLYTTNVFTTIIESRFTSILDFTRGDHFVLYSNSKESCGDLLKRLQEIMRNINIPGHIILLTGDSFIEEKRYSVVALTDSSVCTVKLLGMVISGDVATAGVDLSTEKYVICYEIPTSIYHCISALVVLVDVQIQHLLLICLI